MLRLTSFEQPLYTMRDAGTMRDLLPIGTFELKKALFEKGHCRPYPFALDLSVPFPRTE
jgi:hypothetical protein